MPTQTDAVQYNVTRALKQVLSNEGGSGNANQETAAMRGVIDFLKWYMSRDGKTKAAAKGGGAKMRGEAAALALQAIAFANKYTNVFFINVFFVHVVRIDNHVLVFVVIPQYFFRGL